MAELDNSLHFRLTTAIIEKYKQGVFGALPEPNLLNVLIEKGEVHDWKTICK